MGRTKWLKDPSAVLDFKFDWAPLTNGVQGERSDWLASGETILSHTITVSPVGLTVNSSAITDTSTTVTVWLSGGIDGIEYGVTCRIVTSGGRTDDRTMEINCQNR